jgi:asparagine N-glycosylation enzyme membrane subunit Stt3
MVWAYLSFSQYLIIWSGNLPEEIPWYLRRSEGGWQWVAAFLAVFHFAIPFVLLLARRNKRRKHVLATIAIAILFMRFVDLIWLIVPAHEPSVHIHWMDFLTFISIGCLWLAAFARQFRLRPMLPLNDPEFRLEESS